MATAPTYLAFNSTDDHTFLALLNSTNKILVNIPPILPSTLNLTSDCLATTNLYESLFATDQDSQLLQLAHWLRPALPVAFRNATLL